MSGRELAKKEGKDWHSLSYKEKQRLADQAHISDLAQSARQQPKKHPDKRSEIISHHPRMQGNGPTRNTLMLQAKDQGIKNFRVMNKSELEQVLEPDIAQEEVLAIAAGAVDRWKNGKKSD